MKVAILGAGSIGFATAAFLAEHGHDPVLWSPSGRGTAEIAAGAELSASGALSGRWKVRVASQAQDALADAGAVLLAIDVNGHRTVMERIAPFLRRGQTFIVSAAQSMSGLYLSRLLGERGDGVPIVSWNTAIATAHKDTGSHVDVRTVRPQIDAAEINPTGSGAGLETCRALFGDRLVRRSNVLEIALLSNSNPVFHVPVTLFNISRVELGETWAPYQQVTESVGRLIESIDSERVAIGRAFGLPIHSVNEHFHRSFKIPLGSMAQMNRQLHATRRGPPGPVSLDHRYFVQDVPYGLVFASEIGRIAGVPTPIHDALIALASCALNRDLRRANDLIPALGLAAMSPGEIASVATNGWRTAAS